MHSWICRDLTEVDKLLRSETNSQILSNLHFSDLFVKILTSMFDHDLGRAVNRQPLFTARDGSYSLSSLQSDS